MKFCILCDHCYQPCYEKEFTYEEEMTFVELNEMKKMIYKHKCSDQCRMRLSMPKFPSEPHDYIL